MKTTLEVEGLLAGPQPLTTTAANDEFVGPIRPSTGGWDPYEVWRTRVKAAQDEMETGPGSL
jgi:hypothetical protein